MQLKTTILNLTLAIILTTGLIAAAQGPGGGRGGQGHHPPTPAVDTALDANGDHVISATEIADAASTLMALDTDSSGELSFEECMGVSSGENSQQTPPTGRNGSGGQPPAPPIFSALDTNSDGTIEGNEITDAPTALLKLDNNGDGELQADEIRPSHGGGTGGPPRN